MSKLGIKIDIPGFGERGQVDLRYIVSDYTGTLSRGGRLVAGVEDRLRRLKELVEIHVVSADSFGTASGQLAAIPLTPHILSGANHDRQKEQYPQQEGLDYQHVIALGNGSPPRGRGLVIRSAPVTGSDCS